MKAKFLNYFNYFLMFVLFGVILFACQKDGLVDNSSESISAKANFKLISSSSSCSGTETSYVSYGVRSNPNYFSRIEISKVRKYECDGVPMTGVDTLTKIVDDYFQGTDTSSIYGANVPLSTVVPNYTFQQSVMYCSGGSVAFNVFNIVSYNSSQFVGRPADAAMLLAIWDEVLSACENYTGGTYNLDDLDGMYGYGSKSKLQFALLGYYCSGTFGYSKFYPWISNVPATGGTSFCDQIQYKSACGTGAGVYLNTSYTDVNDAILHFANLIASYNM